MKMRKIFTTLLLISIFLLFGAGSVFAIVLENPLRATSFEGLINGIINFIFYIALVVAPLMVLVGAFYFITAAGDTKRIDTGKRIILYTLIGFAIILLAKGLIKVLEQVIGVKVGS